MVFCSIFEKRTCWNYIKTTTLGNPWPHWPPGINVSAGIWRDFYTGQELDDYPKPFPPGTTFSNADGCLGFDTWWPGNNWVFNFNTSWFEGGCTSSWRGCPCYNPKPKLYPEQPPIMFLRGLCPSSYFRTKNPTRGLRYTPTQHPVTMRDTQFVGGMSTTIFFSYLGAGWTIKDGVYNVTATTTAAKDGYALGKHEWFITGDHVNCHKGENYTTFLKLTGCQDSEFTCNDGACVSMEQRCDQLPGLTSIFLSKNLCADVESYFQIVAMARTRASASCLC